MGIFISIEGIDGSGKTSTGKRLAEELKIDFVEKPMQYIMLKDNIKDYQKVVSNLNKNHSEIEKILFYACGNAYISENYDSVIVDRYLVSNYFHNNGENNNHIFNALVSSLKKPDITFLLYCNNEIRKERMILRNPTDPSIEVTDDFTENEFQKMINFLEKYKFNYFIIDNSKLEIEETIKIMKNKILEVKGNIK